MDTLTALILAGLQIVWINVLLSGDNAVVIALACRGLTRGRRRWAIGLGSLAAVMLRIVLTVFIVALLRLPYLKRSCRSTTWSRSPPPRAARCR